jgi:hypothetical protein
VRRWTVYVVWRRLMICRYVEWLFGWRGSVEAERKSLQQNLHLTAIVNNVFTLDAVDCHFIR